MYNDDYDRELYKAHGFRAVEEDLKRIWTGDMTDPIRKHCFAKFFDNVRFITAAVGVPWRTNDDNCNAQIVSSQDQFLAGTLTNGTILKNHNYVRNVLTSAACYRSKLSSRVIAITLGLRNKTFLFTIFY